MQRGRIVMRRAWKLGDKELAVGAGSAEEETVEAFWQVKTVITGGEVA